MSQKGILHPKCNRRFPDSDRTGHCATCCQTFFGLAAYDKHLVRENGRYWHTVPEDNEVSQWWLDEKQRWHHGPRMSDEQKQQLGWAA